MENTKKMPKIAMGAWAWGNDGTFGDHYTADDLKEVYETAMSNGLNLWDTAFVYGMGTSEKILGELTKDTPAEDLILSTKFTPQCDDGTDEPMLHMLQGSLASLHVDTIDVWWIHNPMDVEKYTPMLIPLAQQGLIKSIGDAHGISVALTATAWAIAKGTLPIVGVTKVHHVEDAAKAASVTLTDAEIALMEKTADDLGLSTIRYWEKKMD